MVDLGSRRAANVEKIALGEFQAIVEKAAAVLSEEDLAKLRSALETLS